MFDTYDYRYRGDDQAREEECRYYIKTNYWTLKNMPNSKTGNIIDVFQKINESLLLYIQLNSYFINYLNCFLDSVSILQGEAVCDPPTAPYLYVYSQTFT